VTGRARRFPPGALDCRPGDHVIRGSDRAWGVDRIEDVVALERLLPLGPRDSASLVPQGDLLDSAPPAYLDEVHLLVTVFDDVFSTAEEAAAAVEAGRLGGVQAPACVPAGRYTPANARIHQRAD